MRILLCLPLASLFICFSSAAARFPGPPPRKNNYKEPVLQPCEIECTDGNKTNCAFHKCFIKNLDDCIDVIPRTGRRILKCKWRFNCGKMMDKICTKKKTKETRYNPYSYKYEVYWTSKYEKFNTPCAFCDKIRDLDTDSQKVEQVQYKHCNLEPPA